MATDVQYKMGGPRGVAFFAVFMTSYTYFITLKVQTGIWDLFVITTFEGSSLLDINVTLVVLGWFLAQCVLYCILLGGGVTKGTKLENGQQLEYNTNVQCYFQLYLSYIRASDAPNHGFLLFSIPEHQHSRSYHIMSMKSTFHLAIAFLVLHINLVVCLLVPNFLTLVNQRLLTILTSSVVLCFILSVSLYLKGSSSFCKNNNGNTGNMIYDWFMGCELNPRILTVDLKYVMFRSGIIGWILLNTCNCVEYYIKHGVITPTLLVVAVLQYFYVADYFWNELGVIMSRDIVHEGLGYNILIQFLMIPFCFSVQTRYILTTNYSLNFMSLAGVIVLYGAGYYIYRASNSEKNNYRKNPTDSNLSYLKTMPTSNGKRLLISGWWGRCRHPNYLGDLLMSASYALATGFNHIIPYLGTLILVLLLIDREKRDNEDCKRKYSADWDKYCSIVRYKIVPWIY